MKKNSVVLPGDELAISEEYLPGKYAYDDSGRIRALLAGRVVEDMVNREISVKPAAVARTLAVGDYVTGQVEAVQSNSAGVRIYYHNGKPTEKGFSGMLLLRREPPGRGARTRTYVKLGDIVRARVSSTLNAIIQLSIDDPRSGVMSLIASWTTLLPCISSLFTIQFVLPGIFCPSFRPVMTPKTFASIAL